MLPIWLKATRLGLGLNISLRLIAAAEYSAHSNGSKFKSGAAYHVGINRALGKTGGSGWNLPATLGQNPRTGLPRAVCAFALDRARKDEAKVNEKISRLIR